MIVPFHPMKITGRITARSEGVWVMQDLYTSMDLGRIHAQLKQRVIAMFSVCAVLLAVCVYSLVVRMQALTIVSVILIGAVLIFCIEMFCKPLYAYEKLIRSALRGRSHTETMVYDHPEPDTSLVDGVSCRSLVLLGAPDKHGTRETMLYWDEQLPLPPWTEGKPYSVKYTGKNIIGWEEAPLTEAPSFLP